MLLGKAKRKKGKAKEGGKEGWEVGVEKGTKASDQSSKALILLNLIGILYTYNELFNYCHFI